MPKDPNNPRAQTLVPIVDSQNPPISVDWVMIANTIGGGFQRICGFSGNPLPVLVEESSGEAANNVWVRPTCVVDFSVDASLTLFAFTAETFKNSPALYKAILNRNPAMRETLKSTIPVLVQILNEEEEK